LIGAFVDGFKFERAGQSEGAEVLNPPPFVRWWQCVPAIWVRIAPMGVLLIFE